MDANPFKGGLVWRKLRRTSGLDLIPIATLSTGQIGVCPVTCRSFRVGNVWFDQTTYKMFVQTVSGPIRMGHHLSLLGADGIQIDITQKKTKNPVTGGPPQWLSGKILSTLGQNMSKLYIQPNFPYILQPPPT
jgi:hypothetical protein